MGQRRRRGQASGAPRPSRHNGRGSRGVHLLARRPAWRHGLPPAARRPVRRREVKIDSDEEVQADPFLNSFLADDLNLVTDALQAGNVGLALASYLTPEDRVDAARRTDVRRDPGQVLGSCDPDLIPPRPVGHRYRPSAGFQPAVRGQPASCVITAAERRPVRRQRAARHRQDHHAPRRGGRDPGAAGDQARRLAPPRAGVHRPAALLGDADLDPPHLPTAAGTDGR